MNLLVDLAEIKHYADVDITLNWEGVSDTYEQEELIRGLERYIDI